MDKGKEGRGAPAPRGAPQLNYIHDDMKYKTMWAEPAHVRRRTCTHRRTRHCQTCASLREFLLSGEQASASEVCLHTHQHTARQPQVLRCPVKHQSYSAFHQTPHTFTEEKLNCQRPTKTSHLNRE